MSLESIVVAVISPNRAVHQQLASALEETPGVGPLWTLGEYPGAGQMAQIGQASAGCVVFLDFSDPIRARAVAAELDNNYPRAAAIAVQPTSHPRDLMELMQLGIREVITFPVSVAMWGGRSSARAGNWNMRIVPVEAEAAFSRFYRRSPARGPLPYRYIARLPPPG